MVIYMGDMAELYEYWDDREEFEEEQLFDSVCEMATEDVVEYIQRQIESVNHKYIKMVRSICEQFVSKGSVTDEQRHALNVTMADIYIEPLQRAIQKMRTKQ